MAKNFDLSDIAAVIIEGKEETLARPPVFACSNDTHQPFLVGNCPLDFPNHPGLLLGGTVRTVGAQFDGDRTDVHDIFAIIWSILIRAFGIASPSLIYEEHGFVPGEISACHIAFTQCPWKVNESNFKQAQKSMNGWTVFGFHLLDEVFKWDRLNTSPRPDNVTQEKMKTEWVASMSSYLNCPSDVRTSIRRFPNWQYFSSRKRGVTVFRMPQVRISALKKILSPFSPEFVKGEEALAMLANGIPNAISYGALKLGKELLNLAADSLDNMIILPIDSHCVFIGNRTVVAVEGSFGRLAFQKEQEQLFRRREYENRVFYAESSIKWHTPLAAKSLENLCLELVLREPGVIRAKPVGDTNDRDGGRDIVIDWSLPAQHKVTTNKNTNENVATSMFIPPHSNPSSLSLRSM